MDSARRHVSWLAVATLAAVLPFASRAERQVALVNLTTPEPAPESVADEADFPFLSRVTGTTLMKTARIDEPLEVKPASSETEAMLAGLSFVQKTYTAPHNVWGRAVVSLYRDALLQRGWRIVDEPPPATEIEPHVINLSAHYIGIGRDLYARVSRTPDGSYQISVADVGAEDWGAMLDRVCHIPIFSIHFQRDLRLHHEDSQPTLGKLAALLKSKPRLAIEIHGHTDNVGDEKELFDQSMRRALMVQVSLITLGAARDQMTVKPFGKSRPLAPNDTDWGRTKNRRIEIARLGCGEVRDSPKSRVDSTLNSLDSRLSTLGGCYRQLAAPGRLITPARPN